MKSSWSDNSESKSIYLLNDRYLWYLDTHKPAYGEYLMKDGNYSIREYFGHKKYAIQDGIDEYFANNKQLYIYLNYVYIHIKKKKYKIYLFKLESEMKKIVNNLNLYKEFKIIIIGDKGLKKYIMDTINNLDLSSHYLSYHYKIGDINIAWKINFYIK